MLDINLFREAKGGDPEAVRASQRKRYADPGVVDEVLDLDQRCRRARGEQDTLGMHFNQLNKDIAAARKAGRDASELQAQSRALKGRLTQAREEHRQLSLQLDELLCSIGNLVDDSVPVGKDEADNAVAFESSLARRGVTAEERQGLQSHPDLVQALGWVDLQAGARAAGGRGFFLLSDGVMLNQALAAYGLEFLRSRGWTPVQTPYWLLGSVMSRCAQLAQFDEELYRLTENEHRQAWLQRQDDGPSVSQQGPAPAPRAAGEREGRLAGGGGDGAEGKYLIATSEQALCALHQDGVFEPQQLPARYAGFSTCFRREAGSHGKDTLGIFRVHQFDKVEQFALTPPDLQASRSMLDEMLGNARQFYESLGIPHRLVRIVSGALNAAASSKVDLEGWFPASGQYRELVSASNCTDYQARRLNVRMWTSSQQQQGAAAAAGPVPKSAHVHMLNATLCATQRTLCCLVENHQTNEGVRVPEVLRPYLHGRDFIPFAQRAAKLAARAAR